MMKKYNKPEIETLALETVDVIETSGKFAAQGALNEKFGGTVATTATIEQNIAQMNNDWQW